MPRPPAAASSRRRPRSSGSRFHALVDIAVLPRRSAMPTPEGNFLFVLRNAQGGFDTKTIDRRNGGHRVTWDRRDGAKARWSSTEEDPGDTFDPRTRPWYQGAEKHAEAVLDRHLPVLHAEEARPHLLDAAFRQRRQAADRARRRYRARHALRLPEAAQHRRQRQGADRRSARPRRRLSRATSGCRPTIRNVKAPLLDELGDPVLTRAYDLLRVEGYGRKVLDFGHRAHHRLVRAGAAADRAATGSC